MKTLTLLASALALQWSFAPATISSGRGDLWQPVGLSEPEKVPDAGASITEFLDRAMEPIRERRRQEVEAMRARGVATTGFEEAYEHRGTRHFAMCDDPQKLLAVGFFRDAGAAHAYQNDVVVLAFGQGERWSGVILEYATSLARSRPLQVWRYHGGGRFIAALHVNGPVFQGAASSRVEVVALDFDAMSAVLVASVTQPEHMLNRA